jgi:hypothetical protein
VFPRSPQTALGARISRRQLLVASASSVGLAAAGPLAGRALADGLVPDPAAALGPFKLALAVQPPAQGLLQTASALLLSAGRKAIVNRVSGDPVAPAADGSVQPDDETWVRPSPLYPYMFARDTFWILAALQSRPLLEMARRQFHGDQKNQPDGHVATALRSDLTQPPGRDHDDESTLMDVLREYELVRLGADPDTDSLSRSWQFIQTHLQNGLYATTGDPQTGAAHYWADTLRFALPQAITYNQGLLCVALEALDHMGVAIGADQKALAQQAYAGMSGVSDRGTLPERLGAALTDVSALAGEALSLYYFGKPILPDARVKATFDHLVNNAAVRSGGLFAGFRVICNEDGSYLDPGQFIGRDSFPGNYHNGGSWLLYDALALYAFAGHGIGQASDLLVQRIATEYQRSKSFHEYTRTSPFLVDARSDYGWNAFVARLIT